MPTENFETERVLPHFTAYDKKNTQGQSFPPMRKRIWNWKKDLANSPIYRPIPPTRPPVIRFGPAVHQVSREVHGDLSVSPGSSKTLPATPALSPFARFLLNASTSRNAIFCCPPCRLAYKILANVRLCLNKRRHVPPSAVSPAERYQPQPDKIPL